MSCCQEGRLTSACLQCGNSRSSTWVGRHRRHCGTLLHTFPSPSAPYYGSLSPYANFSLAHGCARPGLCFDDRIQRARDRVDGQLGGTIEAIATQRRYAKSFVYTWWVSSREWPLDSETNILGPNGPTNRGHRGIVNDHRMEAVGVGCAAEPQRMEQGQPPRPPVASCVAILGFDIADAAPNILGAVTDVSLDQLDGTTGGQQAARWGGATALTPCIEGGAACALRMPEPRVSSTLLSPLACFCACASGADARVSSGARTRRRE